MHPFTSGVKIDRSYFVQMKLIKSTELSVENLVNLCFSIENRFREGCDGMIPGAEVKEFYFNNGYKLYVLNIKNYSNELKNYVDQYIVSIWDGDSDSDIGIVKKEILDFLDSKKESTLRMGAVAEFFVHLLLNTLNFKQECLFSNLEENSIKKGFDGYYSLNNCEWIMESKSGMSTTKGISHPTKIKEAYDDLNNKISGNVKNNPWKNAYYHASIIDVKTSENIRKNIKRMSDNFVLKNFGDIKNFNIIPTSTIFLDNQWDQPDEVELYKILSKNVSNYTCKDMILICATKSSVEILQKILKQ